MTAASLKEQALLLGPRKALVGVLTPPAKGVPPRKVTIVILNSGIIHRVGAHRLHVELARELAHAGFRVLRFDLSGIGDSPTRPSGSSLLEGVMADIREVIDDVVGDQGEVALFGLCSGAAHALLYAPSDERVRGLMLVDLWIPQTPGYHVRRLWRRVSRPRGWLNLLSGRNPLIRRTLRALCGMKNTAAPSSPNVLDDRPEDGQPTISPEQGRAMLADAFRVLVARRVSMLAIFTAGMEAQHNYREQLRDAFKEIQFGDRIDLEWFGTSDHTFSIPTQRQALRDLVLRWANRMRDTEVSPRQQHATMVVAGLWLGFSNAGATILSPILAQLS